MVPGKKDARGKGSEQDPSKLTLDEKVDLLLERSKNVEQLINEVASLKESVEFCANKYDDLFKDMLSLKTSELSLKKDLQVLLASNDKQATIIKELRMSSDRVAAVQDSDKVEIRGFELSAFQSPTQAIQKMAEVSAMELQRTDILNVEVIVNKKSNVPICVVQFRSKEIRDEFAQKCRKERLDTSKLKVVGINNRKKIFINDCLPWHSRLLFAKVIAFKKLHIYKYCWSREGKILLRKDDESRIMHILDEEDLLKLT